jgi:broad specificity phosphatase PhoE
MRTLVILVAMVATWLVHPPALAASGELQGAALVDALRSGGFNLYFRHAATDWSQQDRVMSADDWLSCDPARIRQLSAEGRETARAIGAAMRRLRIPVGEVLASPYCRTLDTARLLGLGEVRPSNAVINMRVAAYFGGRESVIASARRLLGTATPAGSNRVIVAHGNVARDATPVYPGEAEAIVFRPDGEGGFTVVGRLSPAAWRALAE